MKKSVSMSFSPVRIGQDGVKDGVHFEVRDGNVLIGRLTVMRKKLRWWPKGASEALETNWSGFDTLMRKRSKGGKQ
ncbi:MAG: hypothetical protein ACK5JM_09375 [Rhodoblastus sp.]